MPIFKSFPLAFALVISPLAAHATTINLAADDQWAAFGVDSLASLSGGTEWIDNLDTNAPGYGSALTFNFTIDAGQVGQFTVVDASMAGDAFDVYNNGSLLGATSVVPLQQYGATPDVGYDYDAALLDSAFSHRVFTLAAGTYSITGVQTQSLMLDDGNGHLVPLNFGAGAVKLSVSAVPEPSSLALLLAALGVTWLVSRRNSTR
ncbi:MAG TPA: PEP-CTERM sorting domain-containing protein [Aquabacterium sp.]|uniref:PEP-CTERM sorting domain-containing protein n=1 Tax=Aquabacterium sp. TaxID=1872578 RepID=UPI002E3774CA|nr:PEP-CTERM sorting domain-containing protein [Aquabacterium sp.]HEX5354716.1 PEP-CTERM sorting domain-containing protein [Aquabacterium sp.]